MDRRVDVLLIGGGVASVRCARTLRREGFGGSILLVGEEACVPYNRPPLSKELLREDLPDELVVAEPEPWYERRGIELLIGRRVELLDVERRKATLDGGDTIGFGSALLATGAAPRRPPIAGADRAWLLRTLEDARRIHAAAQRGSRAVIIGGGFIGVEVASSLAAIGVEVTLLELAPLLWGAALGPQLSAWAGERLEAAGIRLLTSTAAEVVEDAGVRVADELLPADFVVAGVGVEPRDGLARAAGLDTADGVLTGVDHATSAPGIFAAGDVARVGGIRVEHWHAAREGGERAALSMLDRPAPERRAPWVFGEVAGHQLDVVGWAPTWDEIRRIGDDDRFALAYLVGGRVAQLAVVGAWMPVEEARALVERSPSYEEVAVDR